MIGAPAIVFAAIGTQSIGKVLYGTFLAGISTPLFVLLSMSMTALVFLVGIRFRMPTAGRGPLLAANLWTAISFVSAFYALKHLPPAVFATIEIGMSLLAAVALTSVQQKAWPAAVRLLACIGIVGGCALLSWAEIAATVDHPNAGLVWTAILASTATGVSSALSVITSKRLSTLGWTPSAVLAHRFYLTIAVALGWLLLDTGTVAMPAMDGLALIATVGLVTVLAPLLLFQVALRRTDALTMMICCAAQPVLSFGASLASPAYGWNATTLVGVLAVTGFVGWDIFSQSQTGAPRATGGRLAEAA